MQGSRHLFFLLVVVAHGLAPPLLHLVLLEVLNLVLPHKKIWIRPKGLNCAKIQPTFRCAVRDALWWHLFDLLTPFLRVLVSEVAGE